MISTIDEIPRLYHFTDKKNLPLIRELGGLLPRAELEKRDIKIPAPGGNEWSISADGWKNMDKYVHLCFRKNHPMEYVAKQDSRISQSVFLEIKRDVLSIPGVLFTNDVANKNGVEAVSIDQANSMVDFEVLYTKTDWSDPAIKARLAQAEKYEVLVPAIIPLNLIGMPDG
ncbi:DarT ssDNA thymidine ADP-ribosyltransferase family protein [Limoniibacter endophyticus]|uniref:DarT domain-containing protein n=1 Tax=Limoniibacter endophyticus TaxID=1565040 RepID=A0A8J3DM90_9HYPH|nr:DarT ssDNA thymidine ADP-ribosyltransferase family protein [Limoniibacter endophyticus]GHC64179.1 hypothetical protein GCM10010136_05990 [Limoniibacter endophyticus]